MKTLRFVIATLSSGAIAGIFLGLIHQAFEEPFIDKAIAIETQGDIAKGESIDLTKQAQYRVWQKGGEIVAAAIYGMSLSSLFGIVFAYSRGSLPGLNNKRKALFLAAIMFFVIFLIPALKYPPNPPAVGNPSTIYYREILYIIFIAVSGFSALVLASSYKKLKTYLSEKITIASSSSMLGIFPPMIIYAMVTLCTYLVLPPNPDKAAIPMNLIMSFRIASILTMGLFWGILGMIVGLFWDRFKFHEINKLQPSDDFLNQE
ncbi:MAG TPA: CbtA family protein [Nitrososphaeraceae archaeon]|nr:CbtA family protein [Nitrososphaeraceae archaeon]